MGKILDSIFGSGNYSSAGSQPQQAAKEDSRPEWTAEDEAQMEQILASNRSKTLEIKLEAFAKLPTEVREDILHKLRKAIVKKAIRDITSYEHYDHRLQDLEDKHSKAKGHNHSSYYSRYRDYSDPEEYMVDKMPEYEDLLKIHADHAVGEVLLGDKK